MVSDCGKRPAFVSVTLRPGRKSNHRNSLPHCQDNEQAILPVILQQYYIFFQSCVITEYVLSREAGAKAPAGCLIGRSGSPF